ncbi:hypothetical protein F4814DRAFT_338912 [Daldinia grandis]|nr:hypothetical protein F4814DRAFT_338912 [Daldinia grandis]
MKIWIPSRSSIFAGLRGHKPRRYSAVTNSVERVNVCSGSSGDIAIDLYNIEELSSQNHLLVYLPPFSPAFTGEPVQLPKFLQRQPTAVINYRWYGFPPIYTKKTVASASTGGSDKEKLSPILHWPTPIHDALIGYSWIVKNLGPPEDVRRNVYLYGSYLGASLAMSLALTEAHPNERMAVQGCIALNGIYNWTKFLPDHPINNPPKPYRTLGRITPRQYDLHFQQLKYCVEVLFASPSGLFDPFASATMFFHSPPLLVPPDFTTSALSPKASPLANVSLPDPTTGEPRLVLKHPNKGHLIFPPKEFQLEIPATLLLHTEPPPLWHSHSKMPPKWNEKKGEMENNFKTQAKELATFMRGSIDRIELGTMFSWDDDYEKWVDDTVGKVQIHDVGPNPRKYELTERGEELAATWLQDKIS